MGMTLHHGGSDSRRCVPLEESKDRQECIESLERRTASMFLCLETLHVKAKLARLLSQVIILVFILGGYAPDNQ